MDLFQFGDLDLVLGPSAVLRTKEFVRKNVFSPFMDNVVLKYGTKTLLLSLEKVIFEIF